MRDPKATSHMRLRARHHCHSMTLIGGKGGANSSSLHTTLGGPREYVNARWCKVFVDSYMASNGSCFMVTWIAFKNHLLEVGLTQNQETTTLQNLTTVNFLYCIMCEDPAWIEFHWNSIWLRACSPMTSHYIWKPMTLLHDSRSVLDGLWTLSFGLSQFHGHGSWHICEVAPMNKKLDFYCPQYGLWMIFKDLLDFHGHGIWSVCYVKQPWQ